MALPNAYDIHALWGHSLSAIPPQRRWTFESVLQEGQHCSGRLGKPQLVLKTQCRIIHYFCVRLSATPPAGIVRCEYCVPIERPRTSRRIGECPGALANEGLYYHAVRVRNDRTRQCPTTR